VNPSTKKGGTLKLVNNADADSYDPARAYYAYVWNLMKGYYVRTLITNESKPGEDGLKLVPDLAQAMPEISADGKTYTFKLKSGSSSRTVRRSPRRTSSTASSASSRRTCCPVVRPT